MKFALEHQNPFITAPIISKDPGPFPETTYSLLTVRDSNVLLWAVKPAEEGIDRGIITRFWNLSDSPSQSTIALTPGITKAERTTHLETTLETVSLTEDRELPARFARQQIQTYRLLSK